MKEVKIGDTIKICEGTRDGWLAYECGVKSEYVGKLAVVSSIFEEAGMTEVAVDFDEENGYCLLEDEFEVVKN